MSAEAACLGLRPRIRAADRHEIRQPSMRTEPFKVIVWGPGTIGRACLREVLGSPAYELVGVLAYSESKQGRDAGELVGERPVGVRATTDKEAILALDADVVLHAAQMAADMTASDRDVVALLKSGKNVISSTGYHYPFRHGRDYVEMLHRACKQGGASLLGTGVHPGFMGDILALTLSGLCSHVETLTIREFVDVSHSANVAGLQLVGFNGDPAELQKRDNPLFHILERYWGDTLAYLARVMFDEDARIERRTTFVPGAEEIRIPGLTIAKGRVAATRHVLTAAIDGKVRLIIDEYLYQTKLTRPYPYVDSADFYEVEIEGRPTSVRMRMAMKASLARNIDFWPDDPTGQAWYATATPMLQAIPLVVPAEPGLMLAETPRHFLKDPRGHQTMRSFVRRELSRLGIEP
jgi:hypothetical protein